MSRFNSILSAIEDIDDSHEGYTEQLKIDLAAIILRGLDGENPQGRTWSQRQLSKKARMPETYISRVVHGEANCELSTVGKILYALGVPPAIYDNTKYALIPITSSPPRAVAPPATTGNANGQKIRVEKTTGNPVKRVA